MVAFEIGTIDICRALQADDAESVGVTRCLQRLPYVRKCDKNIHRSGERIGAGGDLPEGDGRRRGLRSADYMMHRLRDAPAQPLLVFAADMDQILEREIDRRHHLTMLDADGQQAL